MGLWDEIKKGISNAGNAAKNIDNLAITTAQNTAPKPAATPKPATTQPAAPRQPSEADHQQAQQYAQRALDGTSGRYVPSSQTPNAMMNAQTPLTPVPATGGGGTSSGQRNTNSDVYAAYAAAQAQQNQDYMNRITGAYNTAIDSTTKQKETAKGILDQQFQGMQNDLTGIRDTARADAQTARDSMAGLITQNMNTSKAEADRAKNDMLNLLTQNMGTSKAEADRAKNEMLTILQQQYGMSEKRAKRQLDDAIARADQQKELMGQQRQRQLDDTKQSNAQAAENGLRDAYANYVMGTANMGQLMKASGINGGASESAVMGMQNNYQNNRNSINLQRNDADRQALKDYNTGINQDAMNYNSLVNDYNNNYYNALTDARNNYNSGVIGANTNYNNAMANILSDYNNGVVGAHTNYNNAMANILSDYNNGMMTTQNNYNNAMANANSQYGNGMMNARNNYYSNQYNLENSTGGTLTDLALQRDLSLANAMQGGQVNVSQALRRAQSGGTSGGGQPAGVRIGNNQTVHTNGQSLLQELYDLGFTEQQAREYLTRAGLM